MAVSIVQYIRNEPTTSAGTGRSPRDAIIFSTHSVIKIPSSAPRLDANFSILRSYSRAERHHEQPRRRRIIFSVRRISVYDVALVKSLHIRYTTVTTTVPAGRGNCMTYGTAHTEGHAVNGIVVLGKRSTEQIETRARVHANVHRVSARPDTIAEKREMAIRRAPEDGR